MAEKSSYERESSSLRAPRTQPAMSTRGVKRERRKFVLCFDGTGNKFQGNGGDSNILKIYSMLERNDHEQFHYYQPGIGTYTNTRSLSHTSTLSRLSSWYNKAKDSAVGTTLDEHVMAGYRFLMRYYQDGDDIFMFGFSRGAYIARFLAEMLDHIGLLSAGNEELIRFVWKTFSRWQQRRSGTEKEKKEYTELARYMRSFRETFSRPVRRIRFLGLFDTVNSVAKFETAWLKRKGRFPYSVCSTALVVRHAVSIDERRAKFRQDLVSQVKRSKHEDSQYLNPFHQFHRPGNQQKDSGSTSATKGTTRLDVLSAPAGVDRFRSRSRGRPGSQRGRQSSRASFEQASINPSPSENCPCGDSDSEDEDEKTAQDIDEVWFAGGHADVGGGWPPEAPEKYSLSHAPLVWMVRQAQQAGLVFDSDKLKELGCHYEEPAVNIQPAGAPGPPAVPQIEINDDMLPSSDSPSSLTPIDNDVDTSDNDDFNATLQSSCTRSRIHDCLEFGMGLGALGVLSWKAMEYLPFRRMDLQADGSWKPIRWPLPMGEVRDIPRDVKVHNSVVRRMMARDEYRPGNLLIGGGGRGVRFAKDGFRKADWVVLRAGGHPIDEVWVLRQGGQGEKEEKEV